MNVTKPEKVKMSKKQKAIYAVVLLVCAISILVAVYMQAFKNMAEIAQRDEEEQIEELKMAFDENFTNKVTNINKQIENKIDKDKEIVYTGYEKVDNKLNSYDVNVFIPYINIENEITKGYNSEIEKVFKQKTEAVLQSQNKNIIYSVEYVANVQDDILSVMIRSNLKEGSSAQRVIIQTYNYDLKNNKEVTLKEYMESKQINLSDTQNKINEEIKLQQDKVESLKQLGYEIYNRNVNDNMYKIENTKEFYIAENALYIVYAYGNNSFTSEVDMIVI